MKRENLPQAVELVRKLTNAETRLKKVREWEFEEEGTFCIAIDASSSEVVKGRRVAHEVRDVMLTHLEREVRGIRSELTQIGVYDS